MLVKAKKRMLKSIGDAQWFGAPHTTCVLLVGAIYLMCQCTVNWSTLRDNCNDNMRWAGALNTLNFVVSLAVVAYLCCLVVRLHLQSSGD